MSLVASPRPCEGPAHASDLTASSSVSVASTARGSVRKRSAAFADDMAAAPHLDGVLIEPPPGVDAPPGVEPPLAPSLRMAVAVTVPRATHSTRKSSPRSHPTTAINPPLADGIAVSAVTQGAAPVFSRRGSLASPISSLAPATPSHRATATLPEAAPAATTQSVAPASAEATCTREGDVSPATRGATSYSAYVSGTAPPSVERSPARDGSAHACTLPSCVTHAVPHSASRPPRALPVLPV
mmetsp:Transcript_8818/g.34620  ORF Transcript_8818/g.34620 Transcript_8818/m.34620 type:complete len:241 (+) Transcript_8818:172-894(+)